MTRAIGPGADMRYGMSEHRDFANGGGDFALRVLQPLNANAMPRAWRCAGSIAPTTRAP